jgi:hypothetical protein
MSIRRCVHEQRELVEANPERAAMLETDLARFEPRPRD